MLTLCPSSAPSETGLCLSGGWLLNQTLTFSFLRHEVCQMHKFFFFLYKPQCLYCTPYHIFTHSERRPAVSIQRKTKKWLSIIVVLCETGGPSLHFWQQAFFFFCHNYRDHVKEMNRWMDRGGGGNIDHVLWARQSDLCGDGEELPLVFLSRDPPSQHSCPR